MEIKNKKELDFCIMADRMMNRGKFCWSFKDRFKMIFFPDYLMKYLRIMRLLSYYENGKKNKFLYILALRKFRKLGVKLGFSIGWNCLGYGVVIPHYGTIVIGPSNRIGNYSVIHTSTCISDNGKDIGDGLYLSTGAKITSKVQLGRNISVGANSLVNKSYLGNNALIGGVPAIYLKAKDAWYSQDLQKYGERVKLIEELKKSLGISTL